MDFKNLNLDFKSPLVLGIIAAVVIGLMSGGFLIFSKFNQPTQAQKNSDEVKRLVEEVGKLIDLPPGETPTIATVTDITKLKDQPFFQRAKNGDKVLIYANAKRAILYDPKAHKVIDVAPINAGPSPAPSAKIILRNGTQTIGLTTKVETDLKKSIPNLNVVDKENASRDNYEKTLIIVYTDSFKDLAGNISKLLKADIVNEASGEARPKDGDILIILGKDRT